MAGPHTTSAVPGALTSGPDERSRAREPTEKEPCASAALAAGSPQGPRDRQRTRLPERLGIGSLGALLLVGLLIRESLCFWTGHPYDFEIWIRTGSIVAHGANPYGSLAPPVPGASFSYPDQLLPLAAYPPPWSVLLGMLFWLWERVGGGDRFVLYLLLKQAPILGDLGSAVLLYRLAERWTGVRSTARSVAAFWLLSPYTIVVSAVWGQFDSLIVLTLLSFLWVRRVPWKNSLLAAGILVKWFTVVLLPFELVRSRRWARLGPILVVVGIAVLAIGFFRATGWGLDHLIAIAIAESQGTGGGMNYAHLFTFGPVETGLGGTPLFYATLPYLWVPAVVVAGTLAARWPTRQDPKSELRAVTFVTSVFLVSRWGLNEQYFLYLLAPLALDVAVFHPGRRGLLRLLSALALAYLLIHDDLGLVFLGPVRPGLVTSSAAVTASGWLGDLKIGLLLTLAILMTVALAHVVYVLWTDQGSPRPWVSRLAHRWPWAR
ncbi:MAG TPA: hypothetical protein VGS23_01610 [Thermoplasmata archaeon]|nr:hypothetical protein [Thermoplasmata archaeon]